MSKQFYKISVIGLGYVGLPLSLQFARSGVKVLGLILIKQKVDAINAGKTYLKHFSSESIAEQVKAGRLRQQLTPPDYQRWMQFLYVFPLPWMIIVNPIFPLFLKQPVLLPVIYLKAF